MLKRIIVNEKNIVASSKAGYQLPSFELKVYDSNGDYSHSFEAFTIKTLGNANVIHDPSFSICGSACFIETTAPVLLNSITTID